MMANNEIIERVANVIASDREECGDINGCPPEACRCLRLARAAIEEHIAALKESGFVIVPREPSDDMDRAAVKLDWESKSDPTWRDGWRVMVDAVSE
jgi:bacterioferritin-associated ferredoxin